LIEAVEAPDSPVLLQEIAFRTNLFQGWDDRQSSYLVRFFELILSEVYPFKGEKFLQPRTRIQTVLGKVEEGYRTHARVYIQGRIDHVIREIEMYEGAKGSKGGRYAIE